MALFRLCCPESTLFEKPHAVQKVGTARSFQITKHRVAFFKRKQAVQTVGTAHCLDYVFQVALIKTTQVVETIGTIVLFRLGGPELTFLRQRLMVCREHCSVNSFLM